ncbi:MAG: putative sugar nucleotidyl transferase, partial [Bacteroidota bacterium]
MAICLFEDLSISSLLPLTHLNPDFDLRCGIFTGRERIQQYFSGEPLVLYTRMGMVDVVSERTGLPVNTDSPTELYINGTALLQPALAHAIREHRGEDMLFASGNILIAATVVSEALRKKIDHWLKSGLVHEELSSSPHSPPKLSEFAAPVTQVECDTVRFPWNLIDRNGPMITADAQFFMLGTVDPQAQLTGSVELIDARNIFIGPNARIGSGVVL